MKFIKLFLKKIYYKFDYAWYLPVFLKFLSLSNELFKRKWYLNYLPKNFKFDEEDDYMNIIRNKSIDYFEYKKQLPKHCRIINSGNNNSKKSKVISNEKYAYRFILNPLIALPELKYFLLGKNIAKLLKRVQELKIVGINLRISDGNYIEEKTTCFHRDFNGFQTIKIFIPLLDSKESFLEYFPNTVLRNPWLPFYSPKHKALVDLKKKFKFKKSSKTSSKCLESTIVNSSCIHRELPSNCRRLNIILTLLPHLDYGRSGLKISDKDSVYFKLNEKGNMEMIYI